MFDNVVEGRGVWSGKVVYEPADFADHVGDDGVCVLVLRLIGGGEGGDKEFIEKATVVRVFVVSRVKGVILHLDEGKMGGGETDSEWKYSSSFTMNDPESFEALSILDSEVDEVERKSWFSSFIQT